MDKNASCLVVEIGKQKLHQSLHVLSCEVLQIEDREESDLGTTHLDVIGMWMVFATENVDETFRGRI